MKELQTWSSLESNQYVVVALETKSKCPRPEALPVGKHVRSIRLPRMMWAFKQTKKKGDGRINQSCRFRFFTRQFIFTWPAFQFFVMQSRYMLFFVFSHVAVRIDASATYRVRVVYIYLVPRVLRFSPFSTSLFCFVIVITFAVHGHCFQRISTSSLVQRWLPYCLATMVFCMYCKTSGTAESLFSQTKEVFRFWHFSLAVVNRSCCQFFKTNGETSSGASFAFLSLEASKNFCLFEEVVCFWNFIVW